MLRHFTLAIALFALAAVAHADPATAPYAAAQLRFAEAELARADEARARGHYEHAWRLAEQAQLDARLAWSMSDSPHLRQAAAKVSQAAVLLKAAAMRRANHAGPGVPRAALIQP